MSDRKSFLNLLDPTDILLGISLFIVVTSIVMGSRILRLENTKAIVSEDVQVVYLESQTNLEGLITSLKKSSVSFDESELRWAAKLLGWRRFMSGRYEIDGSYSYEVLLSRLSRGIQDPVALTILSGITKNSFIATVSEKLKFDNEDLAVLMDDSLFLSQYDLSRDLLLGRMLPNTYLVYWDSSPESFLSRILNEFNKKVIETHAEQINSLRYNINEIVTLASIVEWEAKMAEEMPIISGLYWNRLKKGMRLQADPTVNFALGERRRLLYEDYKYDHPYNTYLNRGLPPGPITNPSIKAIEAALYPDNHNFIYMVASPEGSHVFSESYSEHLEATQKWQKWLRKQYRIKRQREAKNSSS